MTEGDVSERRSIPAEHGGEWPYNFLLAVGSTVVYCYRCTNVLMSGQTIYCCFCNAVMSTEPDKLICTKLSFQMNHASICGTTMATCLLDALPGNAAFQIVLSNDIVA
ncbi:hypothetical protein TNCV_3736011 [Trichonephila clavipes]|nr:hypothetical protein TNCV_3736011 [Trichonephila clavipes]